MSATNLTREYKLPLFTDTDEVSFVGSGSFNEAMEIIDETLVKKLNFIELQNGVLSAQGGHVTLDTLDGPSHNIVILRDDNGKPMFGLIHIAFYGLGYYMAKNIIDSNYTAVNCSSTNISIDTKTAGYPTLVNNDSTYSMKYTLYKLI